MSLHVSETYQMRKVNSAFISQNRGFLTPFIRFCSSLKTSLPMGGAGGLVGGGGIGEATAGLWDGGYMPPPALLGDTLGNGDGVRGLSCGPGGRAPPTGADPGNPAAPGAPPGGKPAPPPELPGGKPGGPAVVAVDPGGKPGGAPLCPGDMLSRGLPMPPGPCAHPSGCGILQRRRRIDKMLPNQNCYSISFWFRPAIHQRLPPLPKICKQKLSSRQSAAGSVHRQDSTCPNPPMPQSAMCPRYT